MILHCHLHLPFYFKGYLLSLKVCKQELTVLSMQKIYQPCLSCIWRSAVR